MTTESQPRKEDAATQQIAREAIEEIHNWLFTRNFLKYALNNKHLDEASTFILSAIERARERRKPGSNDANWNDPAAQPQPSKARKEQAPRAQGSPTSCQQPMPCTHPPEDVCPMCQPQPSKGSPASGERSERFPVVEEYVIGDKGEMSVRLPQRSEQYDENALVDKLKLILSEQQVAPRGQQQEWTQELVGDWFNRRGLRFIAAAHNVELAAKQRYIDEIRTTTYSDLEKELATERQRREQAEHWLGELLAVIHCDGGHYQSEHGIEQATKDAIEKLLSALAAIENLIREDAGRRPLH